MHVKTHLNLSDNAFLTCQLCFNILQTISNASQPSSVRVSNPQAIRNTGCCGPNNVLPNDSAHAALRLPYSLACGMKPDATTVATFLKGALIAGQQQYSLQLTP